MKVMGIDASTTCTGYAFFDENKLIHYSCIKPNGTTWQERLINEGPKLNMLIEQWKPDVIIMENVPLVNRQLETLVILGAVQGYILSVASSHGVEIKFVMPSEWRSKVGLYDGTKRGMKRDVLKQRAIEKANKLFHLDLTWVSPRSKKNQDDIAESILIAYSQIQPRS